MYCVHFFWRAPNVTQPAVCYFPVTWRLDRVPFIRVIAFFLLGLLYRKQIRHFLTRTFLQYFLDVFAILLASVEPIRDIRNSVYWDNRESNKVRRRHWRGRGAREAGQRGRRVRGWEMTFFFFFSFFGLFFFLSQYFHVLSDQRINCRCNFNEIYLLPDWEQADHVAFSFAHDRSTE